jgi:hypothetical protein
MKKISILFTLILFCFSFSQEITLSKSGRKFQKNGVKYKISEYKTQFQNPISKTYIKEGRGYKTAGSILGFAGGLLVGAGLPNALSADTYSINSIPGSPDFSKTKIRKPGWTLVGIGIGLVAVAIPVAIVGSGKIKKGIETENKLAPKSENYYQLDFTGNGFALSYNF